jgi:hypothetical protein
MNFDNLNNQEKPDNYEAVDGDGLTCFQYKSDFWGARRLAAVWRLCGCKGGDKIQKNLENREFRNKNSKKFGG